VGLAHSKQEQNREKTTTSLLTCNVSRQGAKPRTQRIVLSTATPRPVE
jgi:hypothetical protein